MMNTMDMLRCFHEYRGNAIVIPGRAGRHWIQISQQPSRDVPLMDPAMGGHAAFAFGLALAQPDHKVVLLDSEGDLLMALGILPTIAEHRPRNFYHFMLDNECYATTGGQPVPNAKNVSYDGIARCAGYLRTFAYDDLDSFARDVSQILTEPGPVFVALKIVPEIQNVGTGKRKSWMTRTRAQALDDLRQELGIVN